MEGLGMIEKFITENLYETEDFIRIPVKEIYERYTIFCSHYEIKRMGRSDFYKELDSFGVTRHEKSPSVFVGWYIRPCNY